MFRNLYTTNLDLIPHETPTYLNQHNSLESKTCGSVPSKTPSVMCSHLFYTGSLLDNLTDAELLLIQQITKKINDKNNLAKQQAQTTLVDSNNYNISPDTQNPSQNQVTINVFQQNINVAVNLPATNQDTSNSNDNSSCWHLHRLTKKDPIPWHKMFQEGAYSHTPATDSANLTGELFNDNKHYSENFNHPLDQLPW